MDGLIFFSILPIKNRSKKKISEIIYAVPFIGLILGTVIILPVLLIMIFRDIDVINSIIIILMSILVTGCLHEDGLADFCDSFGGNNKKSKLEIMDDSRVGAYGMVSINISLLIRFMSLFYLFSKMETLEVLLVVISNAILSRTTMLYILTTLPPAKKTGLGMAANQKKSVNMFIAYGVSVISSFLLIFIFVDYKIFFVSVFAAIFSTLLLSYLAMRTIKGQTGDICGSSQQFSEVGIYFSICIII